MVRSALISLVSYVLFLKIPIVQILNEGKIISNSYLKIYQTRKSLNLMILHTFDYHYYYYYYLFLIDYLSNSHLLGVFKDLTRGSYIIILYPFPLHVKQTYRLPSSPPWYASRSAPAWILPIEIMEVGWFIIDFIHPHPSSLSSIQAIHSHS